MSARFPRDYRPSVSGIVSPEVPEPLRNNKQAHDRKQRQTVTVYLENKKDAPIQSRFFTP
jgi:hypothetical protein